MDNTTHNESTPSIEDELAQLRQTVQEQQLALQRQGQGQEHYSSSHSSQVGMEGNNDVDGTFADMMKNLHSAAGEGQSDNSIYDAEIAQVMVDIEQTSDFGPEVVPFIADAYIKTVQRPISKETLEKLKKDNPIPGNCKQFQVPKMNTEIWQNLTGRGRLSDLKQQQHQQSLSMTLVLLAQISDEIAKNSTKMPKEVSTKVLKLALDAANITGTQMQEINKKRRLDVKPSLSYEYHGICTAKLPPSEFLFGDNFAETLKSTKATSTVIRSSSSNRGKSRYHPFQNSTQYSAPLNFHHPSNSRGRWNGTPGRTQRRFSQTKSPNHNQFQQRPQYHNSTQFKKF